MACAFNLTSPFWQHVQLLVEGFFFIVNIAYGQNDDQFLVILYSGRLNWKSEIRLDSRDIESTKTNWFSLTPKNNFIFTRHRGGTYPKTVLGSKAIWSGVKNKIESKLAKLKNSLNMNRSQSQLLIKSNF